MLRTDRIAFLAAVLLALSGPIGPAASADTAPGSVGPGSVGPGSGGPSGVEPGPSYRAATAAQGRELALEWWQSSSADPELRNRVLAIWSSAPADAKGAEVLETLCSTFALADPQVQTLMTMCASPRTGVTLPDTTWLLEPVRPSLVRNNLRLWYGRWLVQERLYDEAQAMLAGLEPGDVVDPATLLFHQGAMAHRLLDKEGGLRTLGRLLDETADVPQRYVALGTAMRAELKEFKDGSLDHVAREMNDVERRLDLGHAGPKVRGIEDDIIAKLDKMIEELEKKQKQQQGGGGGGGSRSSSPAQQSQILGGKGPGDVEQKPIGSQSGWGDLPPKARQEALQQIGKDFPSHYREAIEEYFRSLAADDEPSGDEP